MSRPRGGAGPGCRAGGLDHVCYVAARPVEAELLGKELVQQLPGASDERLAGEVLVVARRLPHQHEIGSRVSGREDHVGAPGCERASDAAERDLLEIGEGRH